MSELLSVLSGGALTAQSAEALLQTNEVSRQYGLSLTHEDARALIKARDRALKNSGRIEIGGGVLDSIILTFCGSPYLNEENYVETIGGLAELFYEAKNDTQNQLPDDELIGKMRSFFDDGAGGSLEKTGSYLEQLAYNLRFYGAEQPPEEPEQGCCGHGHTHRNEAEDTDQYYAKEDDGWRSMKL